jgi:peptidoglycan L-alanyl-D-glutamate endopeptidase CwlK
MTYVLGERSRKELVGVHPALVEVVEVAITITTQDFGVHDGLRTIREQEVYFDTGASQTMDSKHLPQPDGWGHAVDLVPYLNGKLRWEWPLIYPIAAAVKRVALEHKVELVWGGVWDRPMSRLSDDLAREVRSYTARMKAKSKRAFLDGPHFQLA